MLADTQYDVYVTATGSDSDRRAAMPYLVVLHPLDEPHADALVRGERVLLLSGANKAEADRIAGELRDLGFHVDLESAGAVELERAPPPPAAPNDNAFFNVSAGLVGLDGDDEPAPPPPKAPPMPARAAPVAAPKPAPTTSRFRPANMDDPDQQLVLDRAPSASRPEMAAEEAPPVQRCGTHDVVLVRGRCSRCDAEDTYVRSRVMGGKLRDKPQLRYGIGIGAGLLIGWIITAPMARRGEMQVSDLREQAAREKARPTDEGQVKAAKLTEEADDLASGALAKTYGSWALIIAAVTAGWLKLT